MNNKEAKGYILNGGRLSKPEGCYQEVFELMERCWKQDPLSRPEWHIIFASLQQLLAQISKDEEDEGENVKSPSASASASVSVSVSTSSGGYYYGEQVEEEISQSSIPEQSKISPQSTQKANYVNDESKYSNS